MWDRVSKSQQASRLRHVRHGGLDRIWAERSGNYFLAFRQVCDSGIRERKAPSVKDDRIHDSIRGVRASGTKEVVKPWA